MVDNNNFREQRHQDPYRDTPDRVYRDTYGDRSDYPNPNEYYDRPSDRVYSRQYYEPGVSRSVDRSASDSYDPAVDDLSVSSTSSRPASPGEVAATRGFSRRNRFSDPYQADPQYRSDIQEVHRSNNIAIGLLLGVLLTSIIGILAAIFYFATTEPRPATVDQTQPVPTAPQVDPADPQTGTPAQ